MLQEFMANLAAQTAGQSLPKPLTIDEAGKRALADAKAREEALKPKPPVKVVSPAKQLDHELKKIANKQAAEADNQRGVKQTQTQGRAKVPGNYEYEVQNARKRMGIKEGSPEDDLLKSAVYMAIIDDPDKPAYQKKVDKQLLKRNLELLKSNPAQIEKERQEYRARQGRLEQAPKLAERPQADILADRRRAAIDADPALGLTLQESDRVRGNIKQGLDKVMPGSVVNEFLSSLLNPLQSAETLAFGVGSAQQIGQGNKDFKAGDVVGPAIESILTVAGAGASNIGLKTIREVGELGDVAKATQKLIDVGVDANKATKAAEAIVEAKQAGKLDDVLADPRIAKFNETQTVPEAQVPKIPDTSVKPVELKPLGPGAQRITKARVNEIRESLGLPETAPGKRPWEVDIEKAVNEGFVDKALDTAKELEVKSRPLETHEQFAFGIKLQELDDELIKVQKQLADAVESGDEAALIDAKILQQDLQDDIDTLTLVLNKSGGTDVARSLASRRAYINTRLEQPRAYAVAQVGRKLDPTESAKIDELVSEIERLKNEVKNGPATRLKAELAPRVASRRKIDVSIEKATADYNAAKARAQAASKQLAGKGRRGGAVNPFLFDVAYHGAKLQLLKGVRVLDDIIKAIRADVPDADENDILQAIDQAEKDLRVPGKPQTKPNLTTLRKEVADALEAANPEAVSYYQQIQDDLGRVLKQGPPYGDNLQELADRVARAKRSFAQGKDYGWDIVARGQNAMQDPEFIKLRGQLKQTDARLQNEVKNIVEKDRRATLTKGQRFTENLVGGLMNSRQLLTGPDTSFGLRQGMSAILQGHYREGFDMVKRGIQSFGSTDKFNDIDAMVRGSRRYDEAVTAGLDLTDFTAGQVEEDALAGLLGRNLNVKGKNINPYAASNRAYTASANSIRLDVYTKLADALEKPGKSLTGEEATLLADFVNTMSGRTSWLKNSGKATKVLNGVAFAPKYALSRIEFLSGAPLKNALKLGKQSGDMRLAATIGKEYMKFYGSVGAMLTVLNFAKEKGWIDGDLDPRSSKFGKIGWKNENGTTTYFDLTGGYGSYFTTAYRIAAGLTRAVQGALGIDDPIKPIKNQKGDYTDNLGLALSGVAKGKTSPAVRAGLSVLTEYDPATGKVKSFGQEKSLPEVASGVVTPISLQTAMEGASERQQLTPIESFRNFAWEFFGLGNQTTDLPKVTPRRPSP